MEHQQQVAAFFARLLNGPSIDQLTEPDRRTRGEELRALLQSRVPANKLSFETANQTWSLMLQEARGFAYTVILPLLETGEVVFNPRAFRDDPLRFEPGRVIYRLANRTVQEPPEQPTAYDGLQSLFSTCLRQNPFPFGRCPVCHLVFARPKGKGKPRRYCSESCKAKGIPSAAKRTEYKRQQRQKARERALYLARSVMKQTDSEQERLALLSEAFRKQGKMKNRRQLLFLLKRAGQEA